MTQHEILIKMCWLIDYTIEKPFSINNWIIYEYYSPEDWLQEVHVNQIVFSQEFWNTYSNYIVMNYMNPCKIDEIQEEAFNKLDDIVYLLIWYITDKRWQIK